MLKNTGSIYLHCDATMSHYLKLLMDCICGEKNFRNEIVWCYPPGGKAPRYAFHRMHDIILYYSKSPTINFNHQYRPLSEYQKTKFTKIDERGRKYKEYRGATSDIFGRNIRVAYTRLVGRRCIHWDKLYQKKRLATPPKNHLRS